MTDLRSTTESSLQRLLWGGARPEEQLVLAADEVVDRCFAGADLSEEGDNNRLSLRSVRSVHRLDSGMERDRPVIELETSLDDALRDIVIGVDGPGISLRGGGGGYRANFSSHPSGSISNSWKSPEFKELRILGGGFHRMSSSEAG